MSQAKTLSLKQAHKHWAKLRAAVRVSGAFKIAGREAGRGDRDTTKALLAVDEEGNKDDAPISNFMVTIERIKDSPVNSVMLLAVPLGILAAKHGWAPWIVFWLNFCALIPLSAFMGMATEDISSYTSEVTAGLLNATFGNVVEMMVAVMALYHRDIIVVQSTLLGSILSNLLFVLGSCFLYGGLQTSELNFSSKAGSACTSLLLLASIALVLPTSMYNVVRGEMHESYVYESEDELILPISRYTSVVIFVIYLQFLYFQLVSHKDYFQEDDNDDDGEEEEAKWSAFFATCVLATTSLITAFTADYLVDSIHGYAHDMNLSKSFIGLILVASVGNIPEFYVTLMVAKNNKMDLALTIAVGSSCQMALMVTPFAVLSGWVMDVNMSLDFHTLQIICLLLAVLTVSSVIQGGVATYLHGSLLVGSYIIIGMMFFFLPQEI